MRRVSFQSQMVEAVDGFGDWTSTRSCGGDWKSDVVRDLELERPPLAVRSRLRDDERSGGFEPLPACGRSPRRQRPSGADTAVTARSEGLSLRPGRKRRGYLSPFAFRKAEATSAGDL